MKILSAALAMLLAASSALLANDSNQVKMQGLVTPVFGADFGLIASGPAGMQRHPVVCANAAICRQANALGCARISGYLWTDGERTIVIATSAVACSANASSVTLIVSIVSYRPNSGTADACTNPGEGVCANLHLTAAPSIRAAFDAAIPGLIGCTASVTGTSTGPGEFLVTQVPTQSGACH